MIPLLSALQFLTIVPIKIKEAGEQRIAASMIYFPAVGLFLGLFLAGINALLSHFNLSQLALSVIPVVTLIIITGGLHLDGLSDTADAFLSGKPKNEMLDIMRDSHVGVMGVLSLISVILLKIALLSSVNSSSRVSALLLMCVLSRWSALLAIFFFPYARNYGKAKLFIDGMNLKIFLFSTILTLLFAFAIREIKGIVILLIIAGFTYLLNEIIRRKIGGITGDTLGATIELTEITTLFFVCII